MIFLKTNLKKGSDVMSKKNENINEEVKNAEETAEDIKDTETKEIQNETERQRSFIELARALTQQKMQTIGRPVTGKTNIRD